MSETNVLRLSLISIIYHPQKSYPNTTILYSGVFISRNDILDPLPGDASCTMGCVRHDFWRVGSWKLFKRPPKRGHLSSNVIRILETHRVANVHVTFSSDQVCGWQVASDKNVLDKYHRSPPGYGKVVIATTSTRIIVEDGSGMECSPYSKSNETCNPRSSMNDMDKNLAMMNHTYHSSSSSGTFSAMIGLWCLDHSR